MDPARHAYFSALTQNVENDQRRYKRQWFKFRAQEDESLLDDAGAPLRGPDLDKTLPPAPPGLLNSRPCLWLKGPNVVSTPKRERDLGRMTRMLCRAVRTPNDVSPRQIMRGSMEMRR